MFNKLYLTSKNNIIQVKRNFFKYTTKSMSFHTVHLTALFRTKEKRKNSVTILVL